MKKYAIFCIFPVFVVFAFFFSACLNDLTSQTIYVTDVTIEPQNVSIPEGETFTLVANIRPKNANNQDVTWASSDEAIAVVKDGVVTAVASGTTAITVTTADRNKKAVCNITVTHIPVYSNEAVQVTNNADSGEGSLRQAIIDAQDDDTIIIDPSVKTIILSGRLPTITKNITIEGNGTTLTPANNWIEDTESQLMFINNATVTINRIWFKDGRAVDNGAAINKTGGNLTLVSCIFSGNQTSSYYAWGGAIANRKGALNVKGCTFYRNSSASSGGAIYNKDMLTLTGNLFYGNTAINFPVVYNSWGVMVTSIDNVVDVDFGTDYEQSGWTAGTNDRQINDQPVSPVTFKLLSGSGASGVIQALSPEYPAYDFYGKAITVPASAGAVQSTATGSGYTLDLLVNNSARGSISVTSASYAGGLYSGKVTITANPVAGHNLAYWLVNGTPTGNTNPLNLTLTAHTSVKAVFSKVFIVNNFSDESNSKTTPGTLRHAMLNAQNSDIIRLSGVTPGATITLTEQLYLINNINIIIEGNGIILQSSETKDSLMFIREGGVAISRVWFKNSTATAGGAITNYGNLTLESCIFSGNRTLKFQGGAIANTGTMNIKGCTFYGNSTGNVGGAIYNSGTLTLTGNLFYKNTSDQNYYPVVCNNYDGIITSRGYNIVDFTFGTGMSQNGWTAATGDAYSATVLLNNTTTLKPAVELGAFIPQSFADNMPATDFYGETRTYPCAPGAVK